MDQALLSEVPYHILDLLALVEIDLEFFCFNQHDIEPREQHVFTVISNTRAQQWILLQNLRVLVALVEDHTARLHHYL